MINVKVPGKLFIAGEYSVMHKGQNAILTAVDKYLKVLIDQNVGVYELKSDYGHFKYMLDYEGLPVFDFKDAKYAKAAIYTAHRYLNSLKAKILPYKLIVTSELEKNSQKYGLGSSAAVTVAIIKAILLFHKITFTNEELFKLCVLSQIEIESVSSGADLACCIYDKWVYYEKYDLIWVLQNKYLGTKLVKEKWPNLLIKNIHVSNYDLLVGYTNCVASTEDQTNKILEDNYAKMEFIKFLKDAKQIVSNLENALTTNKEKEVYELINEYQIQLVNLEKIINVKINTPLFETMIKIANNHHIACKISGAGLGDCGIALVPKNYKFDLNKLENDWLHHGITPLDIKVNL